MKIAYLIIVHKNFAQVKRLFEAIFSVDNFYVFHVDAKADPKLHDSIKVLLNHYDNTIVMKSQNCRWGGYSMVNIELEAIRLLVDWNKDWDFFINLSGQDFPLKNQEEIRTFLQDKLSYNFITVFDDNFIKEWCTPYILFRPRQSNKNFLNARSRVERVFLEVPGINHLIYVPFLKRKFLDGVKWYAGWQWMILNREFCEYLFSWKDLNRYVSFFKNTFIPDEGFFQTVIMNSPFSHTVINDYKRSVTWQYRGNVNILTADSYESLIQSSNLFARKFDINVDTEILSLLEKKIQLSNTY
jgi:hypothetical protein